MYARFTERGRQVVVLAQDAARGMGHSVVATEHLLLGLLAEREGVAAWTLTHLGVDLDGAYVEVAHIRPSGPAPTTGQIPFTYGAKRAIELANEESERRGASSVDTEHILLGLVDQVRRDRGADSVGRVLSAFGIAPKTVREAVDQVLTSS
jgi:ATP-dependent Clp protease ATP-binding subunit ClpC